MISELHPAHSLLCTECLRDMRLLTLEVGDLYSPCSPLEEPYKVPTRFKAQLKLLKAFLFITN